MSLLPSSISIARLLLPLAVIGTLGCAGFGAPDPNAPADLVFYGDEILTVDPANDGATAVAVRGSEIIAVGDRADVALRVGPKTRVVELGERALVPGFIDAHGHLGLVMQVIDLLNASSPPVGPMTSVEDIVAAFKKKIEEEEIPPGEFLMGYGYDDSLLAEGRHPDRDDLDRASTEHPIAILHVSGHLATSNTAALALFGMDETTEDPYGGVIRRRPGTREPNGVLEETAAHAGLEALMKAVGRPTPQQFTSLVSRSLDYHARYGVTTIQDGASNPELLNGLRALARFRPLAIDVAAFPVAMELDKIKSLDSVGYSREYTNGLRIAGMKFVLDGSPQGRTAWVTRPYDAGPPGADPNYVAYPMTPPEFYKEQVARLLEARIPVLAHANGDAAIDLMIEGIDEALEAQGEEANFDHRSVTIHAQLAREDQLDEMKRLGIVPSFFAAHPFFWGDWHRKSFGDDRAMRISPLRSARNRELPFTIHNDAPVVPPDMMRLMEVAVRRATRSGFTLGADQQLSVEEALYAVTQGSAYQYFEEDRKGSITVGKQADLVVLERDPRDVPPAEISQVGIIETIARGKTVYRADSDLE